MAEHLPAQLAVEIATARRDITQAIFGGALKPTDDVLLARGAGKGLKIYDELERDPKVFSCLAKRSLALVSREWVVEPGGKTHQAKKAAELARRVLAGEWGLSFDRACLRMLSATLKGFAIGEVIWGRRDGFIVPLDVKQRNPRRFVFDEQGRPRLLTWSNMIDGEELPPRKFMVHRFGEANDDPYGQGLGRVLFWPAFFKRQTLGFWLVCADKFGSPSVKGKAPQAALDNEIDEFFESLKALAQEGVIVMKEGWDVALVEATRTGAVTYQDLCRYMDEEIAVAILGNTLTTTVGASGSRALGDVHKAVQDELVDADADLLSATLNDQLLAWLTELNFPDAPPPKVWRPSPSDEKAEAETTSAKVSARHAALKFVSELRAQGWEPAEPSADLVAQAEGAWRYVGKPEPIRPPAEAAPAFAEAASPPDAVDDLALQLDGVAAPVIAGMVDQVRRLLDEVAADGGTLADVADRLLALRPDLDQDGLAALMAQAMTVAALQGRAEILDGLGDG